MTIHHIGYLVKDMGWAIQRFNALGYETVLDIIYDEYRNIEICFCVNGSHLVELVTPGNEDSVVHGMLKK